LVTNELALLNKKSRILKNTILGAMMSLLVTPASGISLPVHLQCVGNQDQVVSVSWEDYPHKLVVQNQRLEMYLAQKTKFGHMLRFYQIPDSGTKLALIESDDEIKIIYAEKGQEIEVKCS